MTAPRRLRAASLPAALTFSMVAALVMAALIFSSLLGDGLLARLEKKEQAASAIHAACLLYGRDSTAFDSTRVCPFPQSGIEVRELKSMHGLYGRLTLDTGLWGESRMTRSYLTGMTSLPDNARGIYVPDCGTILTIGDDCRFSSGLFLPRGVFRIFGYGGAELDSLTVSCSGAAMPELSAGARDILLHSWYDEADEVILKGRDVVEDTIVWARRIVIDSTFAGCVQAFARDSIVVTEGARLEYPSGVCLVSDGEKSGIRVASRAVIEGYAVILDRGTYEQADGSLVRGLVYAPGRAFVDGSVTGCAFLGNPCCRDRRRGVTEFTLAGVVQNGNEVYAYPELFDAPAGRTVIKRLEL